MGKRSRYVLSAVVAVALAFGVFTVFTDAEAKGPKRPPKGCFCTMEYAPVECDDGKTYSNQCVADCHNATGCVPVGPGPIPL